MIYLILAIGFVLRLININQSLWLDEAIGAVVVKNMTLLEVFTKFPLSDNHPPLYYLILKLWSDYFGYSELSLRFPSIVFGILTVFLVYKITKNKWAAILLATAPLHVYYSQEARMYMVAGFLSALAIYTFSKHKWLLFSFSLPLLMFTDYVPIFLIPVFWLWGIVSRKDIDWWKKMFLSHIPLFILALFWQPIFSYQSEKGKILLETLPAWQSLAGGATLKQALLFWNKLILGKISFYPKYLYYSLIVVGSIPYAISLVKSIKKENVLYWMWFVIPLILSFLTSFVVPSFNYFRFIYVVPAFYILVGSSKNRLLIYLMLVVNLLGLGIYYFNKTQWRENWKEATMFVEENVKEDEIIIVNYPEPFAPYVWYSQDKWNTAIGVTDSISVNEELTKNKVERNLQNYNGVYYFNYLEDLTDPKKVVYSKIVEMGFKNVKTYTFNGIGEVEYLHK